MLTILLPVIKDWTRKAVVEAIVASDIPRCPVILVIDAPGCAQWEIDLYDAGFRVRTYLTMNPYPPEDRIERRPRARAIARYMQTLVPDGPLLCLEDDILVPPDIYSRLSALGPHATGVQIGRHETIQRGIKRPVLYPMQEMGEGIAEVEGCGFGCLLTTGEAYSGAFLDESSPWAVSRELTWQLRPLRVDFGCVCGHLTKDGVILP